MEEARWRAGDLACRAVAPALWPGFKVHNYVDSEHDALDRKTREWVSDGTAVLTVTEYSYDRRGLLVCTAVRMNPSYWSTPLPDKCVPGPADPVNGFDRITKNVYDAAGQLTEVWDGVGTPLQRREAHYSYNRNGQKTSLTDARGFRAEMKYDGHGRQSRWVFPSKTTPGVADQADYEQYGYDAAGNRVSLRKRDGQLLSFDYDALNRVVIKYVPEFGMTVRYAYDLRGLQTAAWFTGTGWGISNAWDGFGRMVSTTSNMGGPSRTVSRLYDREGRRIELTFPDGSKFWTARDGLGRATEDYQGAHGSTAHIMTAFAYDASGRRNHFARKFGDNTSYGYDAGGRLTSQVDLFPGGTGDSRSSYVHNPASQLHTESRTNDAYAWTGSVAANRNYQTNGQNQYTAAGSATFTYDPNGNLTSTTNAPWSTTYAYDSENRLISATGTHNATLVYDPLGRLFQISSASGTTQFLYDGDELVAEYDAAGTMLRRYVHGDSDDDRLYWYEGAGLDQPRFPHTNHQGSVTAVAGPGGTPLWINTYDEYGIPGADNQGRFQYTGQAWLPELGMYYYKARIYSPYLGRFLQLDPIGYEGGINLYSYADADPLNYTDPSGNHPVAVAVGVRCALNAGCRAAVANGLRALGNGLRRLAPAVRTVPPTLNKNDGDSSQPEPNAPVPGTGKGAGKPQYGVVKPGKDGPPRVVRPTHPPKKSDATQEAARGGRHGGVIGSKGDREKMSGRQDPGHRGGPPHGHPPEGRGRGHLWERPRGDKNEH